MVQLLDSEKAKQIIYSNNYLSLATSDKQGKPWIAPLYYAYDKDFNFYFISASESLHMKHIQENENVAATIFDSNASVGEGDGVQLEGTAHRLGIMELPHALYVYFKRRFPGEWERIKHGYLPTKYLGESFFVFVKITPKKVYTLDLSVKEYDKRVEVNLTQS